MPEHPESFPVNALIPIPGTPLEKNEVRIPPPSSTPIAADDPQMVPYHTLARTIATARIVMPTTIIRIAAGRNVMPESEQMMCFMAGANAIFTGEQMLTTPCTSPPLRSSPSLLLSLTMLTPLQAPLGTRTRP